MAPDAAPRCDVVLVGFQDQGNLGMGYLAASLAEHGRSVRLLDYRQGPEAIAARVLEARPLLVGFSLIFQYYLPGYRAVAMRLREAGVTAHLTMGGHYPSLCHDEVLPAVPELDSVVRFEGEHTLVELVDRLAADQPWQDVAGLAYLAPDGTLHESAPRPLVADLDSLPLPLRQGEPEDVVGFRALPLLASRGCARRCSFCSIHTFYREAEGRVVRVRRPDRVVAEMQHLYQEHGVRVFLFQDDDFPLWGRAGAKWVDELADRLQAVGLADRVVWKISCRAEYVEPELFAPLRDVGLYLVYMGLESGTDEGLEILNKRISPQTNERAVESLKRLGLLFEYGFMLFDPSSTFASVRANITFLRGIVGDGSAGAVFCRMLPYGGTPIRDRLAAEGRLRGDVVRPDYDFLDPLLNDYHRQLDRAAAGWIHGHGLSHQLNWAWNELAIMERLAPGLIGTESYRQDLAAVTAASNQALFDLVETTATAFPAGDASGLDPALTSDVRDGLLRRLLLIRNAFVAANRDAVVAAAAPERLTGPALAPQLF